MNITYIDMNPTLPPFSSLSGVRASEQVRNGERVLKKDMEAPQHHHPQLYLFAAEKRWDQCTSANQS